VSWPGVILCVACQALIVVGQLFLKHAVTTHDGEQRGARGRAVRNFALGIGCMTCWFFLWLGLLSRWDISKLFPWEGLNPAMLAIGAWLVLKERMPVSAWIGLALVCVGIAVVAGS
jgi:undecaprenyl phosphate-alpha-L-ara4N flippase subunit ArnE